MAEENKCSACAEKGHTCIPFFVHENAMMHKDMDNERMHETIKSINEKNHRTVMMVCAAFVAIIIIFVAAYTVRTSIWLNTISSMNKTIAEMANRSTPSGPEVADASVHQQSD